MQDIKRGVDQTKTYLQERCYFYPPSVRRCIHVVQTRQFGFYLCDPGSL
jgi:hypothetical protein